MPWAYSMLAMAIAGIMGGALADFRTIGLTTAENVVGVQNYSTSAKLDIRDLAPDEGIYQGEPKPKPSG